jgi:endoglucanase
MKQLVILTWFLAFVFTMASCSNQNMQLSKLSVKGTYLVNEDNKPVVLRGVSYGWHTWWPRFYNASTVQWFKDDWKCNVVRAAMGVEPDSSYLNDQKKAFTQIERVVDGAISAGIYVLIDWHSHGIHTAEAKEFFSIMAKKYGQYPNVIYEIFNEPVNQSWDEIKAYSTEVISAIRTVDPDNVILVGCPHWDQDIHVVADSPLNGFENIMYTVHFYADTHKQWLRDRCDYALAKGIPIFVSECAGMNASGNGSINYEEWDAWISYMEKNKISWAVWSVADKDETCSFLYPTASSNGNWNEGDLKESGKETRKRIIQYNGLKN